MKIRVAILPLLLSTAAVSPAASQDPYAVRAPAPAGFDRAAARRDTRSHLERLISLDTRNPPGNELLTATWLDTIFRSIPGVETHVLAAAEGRANFIARLRATRPTARPVIIMGHMDVVGADTARWTTDPLVPTERGGYLYGRGAIDDKGMLAAAVVAMQQLAPRRSAMSRDIIFVATAGEEGGPSIGIDLLLREHSALLGNAEFALNEGGRIRVADGRIRTVNVQTTEKLPYTVIATARGPGGHGSVPLPDNALAALARASARVHEWEPPVRLSNVTRLYFERLARIEADQEMRAAMQAVSRPGADSAAIARATRILRREPLHAAVLGTGISFTMIQGGFRSNVIPSDGRATFNVRITPDDDIRGVVAEMQRVGGESSVTFELQGTPAEAPPVSPVTTALYRAMERAANTMAPEAIVLPFMSTGATDGAALRAHGIPTYGILPLPLAMEDELRMHGDDERVPLAALGWATEYLYRVLAEVTTR